MAQFCDIPALVTPQEAKRVWDSQRCPSARSVAKALTQAGRPVHFATVARWRRQGWQTVTSPEHPVERARKAVDAASSVLTLDPTLSTQDWIRREGGTEVLNSDAVSWSTAIADTQRAKQAGNRRSVDIDAKRRCGMPVDDVYRGDRPRSISTPAQYVRDHKKWDNIPEPVVRAH